MHRSTQRLPAPVVSAEEAQLRAFLTDCSRRRPRWGWCRAAKAARHQAGIVTRLGAMCPIRPDGL